MDSAVFGVRDEDSSSESRFLLFLQIDQLITLIVNDAQDIYRLACAADALLISAVVSPELSGMFCRPASRLICTGGS